MPALHSLKMERFARFLHETGNQSEAYRRAGYTVTSRNNLDSAASRLSRNVKVKARIRELQGHLVARNRITVDSLLEELDEAKALALRVDQPSAAITATMSKAKLTGLLVERRETGDPGAFQGLQNEQQVMDMVRSELGEEAAQQLAQALQEPAQAAPAEVAQEEIDPPAIEPTNEGSSSLQ